MKKQLLKSALVAVAGVGLLAGSAMAYTVQMFTNYDSWLDEIDPTDPVVENFQDLILEPGFNIFDTNPDAIIQNGVYKTVVDFGDPANSADDKYQIYSYTPGMFAFGGCLPVFRSTGGAHSPPSREREKSHVDWYNWHES